MSVLVPYQEYGRREKTGLDLKPGNKTQEAHWSEKRVTLLAELGFEFVPDSESVTALWEGIPSRVALQGGRGKE